jgi:predicted nucleic acid-binding protein
MALTRIVLDTNVVVSAHLRARGLEAFVLIRVQETMRAAEISAALTVLQRHSP